MPDPRIEAVACFETLDFPAFVVERDLCQPLSAQIAVGKSSFFNKLRAIK